MSLKKVKIHHLPFDLIIVHLGAFYFQNGNIVAAELSVICHFSPRQLLNWASFIAAF